MAPVLGVAAIVVGLVGVALGIVAARGARRGSAAWWMGVVGAVLGAVPTAIVAWYVFATLMGWAEWR